MNAFTTLVAVQTNEAPVSAIDARIAKIESLVGQVIEGVATHVTAYGVFLDIGAAMGTGVSEIGLLHGNAMWNGETRQLLTYNPGRLFEVTIVSVKRKLNFANKLLIELSETAIPVNKLKPFVGTDTKVTGTITGRFDDYLVVELADRVTARLPMTKLGGTSLDALKKGVTVKASVFSVDGMFVTLTRESIDSAHARARREAHRAENRMLDQQYRSSKKSSGNGKNSGGGKKKK